jgi:phospholipid-binding lipoprotein MlaA
MVVAVLLLGGCAGIPSDPVDREAYYEANDSLEPLNRTIFDFNLALDRGVLKPVATVYRDALPATLRNGIRNFLNHLRTPIILANNLLQGDWPGAQVTIARFATNTLIGFGGFGDPASDMGAKFRDEDFGQTLAVWNVSEGPFLMLPLLGPSNPRDVVGLIVDTLSDPFGIWAGNTDNEKLVYAGTLLRGIDKRSRHIKTLDDLEASSLDFYATIRSLYRQIREDSINNGESQDTIPSPSLSFEDDDDVVLGPRAELIR